MECSRRMESRDRRVNINTDEGRRRFFSFLLYYSVDCLFNASGKYLGIWKINNTIFIFLN